MKHSLTVKTTKYFLPILIGFFVVSGTLFSLPMLKTIVSNAEVGYELSDGNAAVDLTPVKMTFVLPLISLTLEDTLLFKHQPEINHTVYADVRTKDIFLNFVRARAP